MQIFLNKLTKYEQECTVIHLVHAYKFYMHNEQRHLGEDCAKRIVLTENMPNLNLG